MELFILFQTDQQRSAQSKVLFGVFTTEELAIQASNENGLLEYESDIVIETTTLNQFGEI